MSNVIQFLEAKGSNSVFLNTHNDDYLNEVASLAVSDGERQALVARDANAINRLLDGREKMMCLIWKQDEESEPGQVEEDEAPTEDAPEEES